MMQYNLRLDETTKQKVSSIAKKKGISENSLYQMAIEEFLSKAEAAEFYEKLLKRVISSQDKKKLLKKLKSNKRAPLYPEDEVD